MPSNTKYGMKKDEAVWKRAFFAMPLLGLFILARQVMTVELGGKLGPLFEEALAAGAVKDGASIVSLRKVYTGWEPLDTFILPLIVAFTPSMAGFGGAGLKKKNVGGGVVDLYAPQRMQAITFLTDFFALNAIWMIESCRQGNVFTFARISNVFLFMAQLFGIGVVAPLYCFLHFVLIPSTKFHAADSRHVPLHFAKTILPTLILGYAVAGIGMYWPTSPISTLQGWNFAWQPFPIYLAIFHRILRSFFSNTEKEDRVNNHKADLFHLRLIYVTVAFLSSTAWIYTVFTSPTPLYQVFLSGITNRAVQFNTVEEGMRMFLKYDEAFCFGSAPIWVLLCFRDLKREGRLTAGWAKILGFYSAVTLTLGPGTGLVFMWGWREDVLAKPRLKEY
ncbi:hypothetical protein ONS95_010127 [Cadophora gregata]|uniref:uncharacterized protein n=1 Tax=Cadophora gregata TaxID=51156 RepID=UPI0026DC6AB4|nr:uncharacterized protein ONS95_010127 [Cadophora gregata]KAK0121847.1 hypothetical protein ONS95_010127 [Cadophora gregata]